MDRLLRVLVIAALFGYSIYRIVRYVNIGVTRSRSPAIPSVMGGVGQNAGPRTTTPGPSTKPEGSNAGAVARIGGTVSAILIWLLANSILWLGLFVPQALANVPVIWRLFVGVFANFYLIPFAGRAGARVIDRMSKPALQPPQ
jgi:fatty acid desaturase